MTYCNFHKRYEADDFCPLYATSILEKTVPLYNNNSRELNLWPHQPQITVKNLPENIANFAMWLSKKITHKRQFYVDEAQMSLQSQYVSLSRLNEYIAKHILYRKRLLQPSVMATTVIHHYHNLPAVTLSYESNYPWVAKVEGDKVHVNTIFALNYLKYGFDAAYMLYLDNTSTVCTDEDDEKFMNYYCNLQW